MFIAALVVVTTLTLSAVSFMYPEGGGGVMAVTFATVTLVGKLEKACDTG